MNRKHIIRNLRAKNIAFDHNLSTKDLNALLESNRGAVNKIFQTFNFAKGFGEKVCLTFNASAPDEPAEILIEDIGKDPWTGEGMSTADMQSILNAITPRGRALAFLTNSMGGDVIDGKGIRALLNLWPGRITNTIIGLAASSGSWCIPADETMAFKSSQMFMHRAMCAPAGNVDDLQQAIDYLNITDDQIAEIYADQSGGTKEEMADLMYGPDGQGTLLTGQQALDLGLIDTLIDGEAKNQFTPQQLDSIRQKIAATNSIRSAAGTPPKQGERTPANPNPTENTMNLTQKIALLNKRGVKVPANCTEEQADGLLATSNISRQMNCEVLTAWNVTHDAETATDAQLKALVQNGKPGTPKPDGEPTMSELQAQIAGLTEANNAAKKLRIVNAIEQIIKDDKLTTNERDDAIELAMEPATGERYLNSLNKRASKPPGSDPVGALLNRGDGIVGESFEAIQKYVLDNGSRFRNQFIGAANATKLSEFDENQKKKVLAEIGARARNAARVIADPKNKAKILAAWNANVIDAGLQRQVILQEYVEEYEIALLPLKSFSTLFSDVVLEGMDELDIPFYPLQGAASNSWNKATGYNAAAATAVQTRKIFIGGSGDNSGNAATVGYCKDRLWQMLTYSSYEQTRQPYVNWQKLTQQNARKLGVDVFQQFVSRVLTRANFGAPSKIVAAALFSADDIADLAEIATGLNWPVAMRALTLNHTYRTPLLKDPTFKQYLAYGNTDPLHKANIEEAYGFTDIPIVPNLNTYSPAGENLQGWINHVSAALFGTAPIMPTEEVRALMTRFDIAISPQLGANICYRRFGNTTLDQTNEVVECSFGGGYGVQTALKLLASQ